MKTQAQADGRNSRRAPSNQAPSPARPRAPRHSSPTKAAAAPTEPPAVAVSPAPAEDDTPKRQHWPIRRVPQCIALQFDGLRCEDATRLVALAVFKHRALFRTILDGPARGEAVCEGAELSLALIVAETVVQRCVWGTVAGMVQPTEMVLPLPGIAGMVKYEWRDLAVLLCAPLLDRIEDIESMVWARLGAGEAAELREMLVLADLVCEIELARSWGSEDAAELRRRARVDMAIALRHGAGVELAA